MTQEQKAKAYDEVFRTAQELYNNPASSQIGKDWICAIFPELKESEDERIKKELIAFIKKRDRSGCDYDYDKWLAWLEKQGEHKPQGKSALEAVNEEKVNNANKVEPKFHEGEWVVCEFTGLAYQIKNSVENLSNHKYGYDLIDGGYISADEVGYYHLWTIQDAKDGDVLQLGLVTAIFQEYIGNGKCKCYCSICGEFCIPSQAGDDNSYGCSDAAPATKEQRDILLNAIYEAGYTFDFEKKKLKKIESKPAEWSEEDEDALGMAIIALNDMYDPDEPNTTYAGYSIPFNKAAERLKSLRPQKKWKPSDEQMDALQYVCRNLNPPLSDKLGWNSLKTLELMFEQLKKLKE